MVRIVEDLGIIRETIELGIYKPEAAKCERCAPNINVYDSAYSGSFQSFALAQISDANVFPRQKVGHNHS